MDASLFLIPALSAAGASVGAYVAVRVALALHDQRLAVLEREVSGLREARHHHADRITELRRDVDHLKGRAP